MTHQQAQPLLSAFADGGLDHAERGRVEAHLGVCPACTDEVKAIRTLLTEVRRVPDEPDLKPPDEVFFRDFARDVRLAYDRAESTSIWAWLRKPALVLGFCAAAVGLIGVVVLRRAAPTAKPEIAVTAPRPLPEAIEDQEDLSPVELERALAAIDGEIEQSMRMRDEEAALASSGGAEQSLENLDDEALQRLDREL